MSNQSLNLNPLSLRERGGRKKSSASRKPGEGRLRILLFVICSFVICHSSFAYAKEYDGIWFLGFNLTNPPFNNLKVRQAAVICLDKDFIAKDIMEEEITPGSLIPPGMAGYDPNLKPYGYNVNYAKKLLKQAKIKDLKNVTLLYTDGVKTLAIALKLKESFKKIGMELKLTMVNYSDEEKWDIELDSGKYSMFLMGYKANIEQMFMAEAIAKTPDSYQLLEPVFGTSGEANFTGYSNPTVDNLLDQLSLLNPSLSKDREAKLKEINKIIYKDLPVVVLFYIEKI